MGLSTQQVLDALHSEEEFAFTETSRVYCSHAQHLSDWIDWLYEDIVGDQPTIFEVKQAKLLLSEQYLEWRNAVSLRHRDLLSKRGHICLYEVFVDGFNRLKTTELSLRPALLFEPPRPPPPQIPQAPGYYFPQVK